MQHYPGLRAASERSASTVSAPASSSSADDDLVDEHCDNRASAFQVVASWGATLPSHYGARSGFTTSEDSGSEASRRSSSSRASDSMLRAKLANNCALDDGAVVAAQGTSDDESVGGPRKNNTTYGASSGGPPFGTAAHQRGCGVVHTGFTSSDDSADDSLSRASSIDLPPRQSKCNAVETTDCAPPKARVVHTGFTSSDDSCTSSPNATPVALALGGSNVRPATNATHLIDPPHKDVEHPVRVSPADRVAAANTDYEVFAKMFAEFLGRSLETVREREQRPQQGNETALVEPRRELKHINPVNASMSKGPSLIGSDFHEAAPLLPQPRKAEHTPRRKQSPITGTGSSHKEFAAPHFIQHQSEFVDSCGSGRNERTTHSANVISSGRAVSQSVVLPPSTIIDLNMSIEHLPDDYLLVREVELEKELQRTKLEIRRRNLARAHHMSGSPATGTPSTHVDCNDLYGRAKHLGERSVSRGGATVTPHLVQSGGSQHANGTVKAPPGPPSLANNITHQTGVSSNLSTPMMRRSRDDGKDEADPMLPISKRTSSPAASRLRNFAESLISLNSVSSAPRGTYLETPRAAGARSTLLKLHDGPPRFAAETAHRSLSPLLKSPSSKEVQTMAPSKGNAVWSELEALRRIRERE